MNPQISRVAALIILAIAAQLATAQCPPASWGSLPMSGVVYASTSYDADGPGPLAPVLVVGGQLSGATIMFWNGVSWQVPGGGTDGLGVSALTVYGGDLIAAGNFNFAGGGYVGHIARWNGSTWGPLGTGLNGFVNALIEYNGELIAAGGFTIAGGQAVNHIARWNGSTWQPLGSGVSLVVQALAVYDGELVAANAGGVPADALARWDGSAWHTLGSGLDGATQIVDSMAVYDGELIVAGNFTTAGAAAASNIASWNGSCWRALGAGITGAVPPHYPPTDVRTLVVFEDKLVAGGNFTTAGTVTTSSLATWSSQVPLIAVGQPGGAGAGIVITNRRLVPGHEYYNVASFDLCPGCLGSGPYAGLCFVDTWFLLAQLAYPVGFHPFHFVAPASSLSVGPYGGPTGFTLQAVCADVTGGVLGCVSPAIHFTVN